MWFHPRHWFGGHRTVPLGLRGEQAAIRYLRRLGYGIISHGQRDRGGEIDIIAVDGKSVVFVEVKTRTADAADRDHPADAVDAEKQRRLTDLALRFLKRHELLEHESRFDVIAVIWPLNDRRPTIEHFQNAFEAVGKGQMYS